jgi:hypothetical protein
MSLIELTITYLIDLIFWLWVVKWGGAEWLAGTFTSGFLISIFAPRWSSDGIKLFGYGAILISTIFFVIAVFSPDFRYFF